MNIQYRGHHDITVGVTGEGKNKKRWSSKQDKFEGTLQDTVRAKRECFFNGKDKNKQEPFFNVLDGFSWVTISPSQISPPIKQ